MTSLSRNRWFWFEAIKSTLLLSAFMRTALKITYYLKRSVFFIFVFFHNFAYSIFLYILLWIEIQCILHFRSCDLKTYDLHTVTVSHYYAYMISIKANHRIIQCVFRPKPKMLRKTSNNMLNQRTFSSIGRTFGLHLSA